MPRPLGRRNPDYEEKRDRLVRDLTDHVLSTELTRQSFRQMAMAGHVAEPTLRHYFGDRDGVAREILHELGARAQPFIDAVAQPAPSPRDAVEAYVAISRAGVAHGGFGRAHAFGLIEGVADPAVGRTYLTELLEPSLCALENRLAPHLKDDASAVEARAAALMLFAPMLLAVLHQQLLGGDEGAPIDLDALFAALARRMVASLTADATPAD
jgi:AcrR family transcriptional regulator